MLIGILALQGDFEAHGRIVADLGSEWTEVTGPGRLDDVCGLIIPGGESTAMLRLLHPGLREEIGEFHARGGTIYGTCAGVILLAREVRNPSQDSLGILDVVVERNGYGRQNESHVAFRDDPGVEGKGALREMVFIRAPLIKEIGPGVEVLASVNGSPVHVEQGGVLATTFHPEISGDPSIHRRFLEKAESSNV